MLSKNLESMIGRVVIEKKSGRELELLRVCDCIDGMGKNGRKRKIARCQDIETGKEVYHFADELE